MKKSALAFAVSLLIATLAAPLALADLPGPTCGPSGCQKPGVRVLAPVTQELPGPTCGPSGCQKPGVVLGY